MTNINSFENKQSLPSAFEMVSHDMGVALLPEFVIQDAFASENLLRVLPEYQGRQWYFIWFIDLMAKTNLYQLLLSISETFFSKANTNIW